MYTLNLIKQWSEAKSFSIFEYHVYSHWKNLMFAQILSFFGAKIGTLSISPTTEEFCPHFCPFWSQNRSTFCITYYKGILPKFLPFLEPKSEHFLYHLLQRNFAQIFALFGAKIRALSISLTTEEFCSKFCLFWSKV